MFMLWVMMMMVWFLVCSLLRIVIIFLLDFVLSVFVGLLVRIILLLFIRVCVIDMCCCWLLESWFGL